MTDLKVLDELERLSKAATPGPWTAWAWRLFGGDGKRRLAKFDGNGNVNGFADSNLIAALRNSADSLIADSRRLQKIEAVARDVVRVVEAWQERGLTDLSIDGIAEALREALEDCGAGAVEPTSPSVEGRA